MRSYQCVIINRVHKPAVKNGVISPLAEETRLLVLGYAGTLRPDLNDGSGRIFTDAYGPTPPFIRAVIDPLLKEATHRLNERAEDTQRRFAGELIPLDSLVRLLSERLSGVLTQAVAESAHGPHQTASHLFGRFPWLRALLNQAVNEWVSATATFLQRLHRDGPRILSWLHLPARTPIESVCGTSSDAHAGGHAVLRIAFQGGVCLYYKPRLVTGEWLWHKLLEIAALQDPTLRLPASRVLTDERRFHYGWVESVLPEEQSGAMYSTDSATANCIGDADYWHAAGATLCLAQHARLTDLHLGNIRATSRGPAVTDAECLATPDLFFAAAAPPGGDKVINASLNSLLSTGLLARKPESGIPDISGLFGKSALISGALSGLRLPMWVAGSGGNYRLTKLPAIIMDQGNAPTATSPIAVLPHLLSGYRQAAQALLRCRKTLLDPGAQWRSVLENAHAPRVVLRDTLTYGLVLSESLAPGHLSSWHRRRSVILARLETSKPTALPPAVLRAEVQALLQLHVPRLVAMPGTRNLSYNYGRVLARGSATCAPVEAVVGQMQTLSAETIDSVHLPALMLAIFSP